MPKVIRIGRIIESAFKAETLRNILEIKSWQVISWRRGVAARIVISFYKENPSLNKERF
jgi:hypothetical protein